MTHRPTTAAILRRMMEHSNRRTSTKFAAAAIALAALATTGRGQTPDQAALAVNVQSSSGAAVINFTWPNDPTATGYSVRRRDPFSPSWTAPTTVPGGGGATAWSDTTVLLGIRYEYWFTKTAPIEARAFLSAGIDVAALDNRGILVLLVDATKAAPLASQLTRLQEDLTGDGWRVLRHDVSPTQSVTSVKALIAADVAANPTTVRAVLLFGRIPVPYSGLIAPDGHIPQHQGAWPADVYYGELHGPWTDSTVNDTQASRPENHNIPGDGKFDQSSLPSDVDLLVGRVDLSNLTAFAASETALLQAYLDKNHAYRQKAFTVDQRAVIDDNFGWFLGEAMAISGWRNFQSLVGPANVLAADYFGTLNTGSGNGYAWSYGCGSGGYTGATGVGNTNDFAASFNRNTFTLLFGSGFGDWDTNDAFLRAPLAQGWTLAAAWSGRPHWALHPMGMGETIGHCARLSQNDTSYGGFSGRQVHVALMGDPTLRQHIVAPPTVVAVVATPPQALVTWQASADVVAGYHVYRSANAGGPFARLTSSPVTGLAYTDPSPIYGNVTYMVRALRREQTPTGSYWNLSQGAFLSTTLQQPASHTSFGVGCYAPNALSLAASPAPISTATSGTLCTYAIGNAPETAPGSGTRIGLLILSLNSSLGGLPLAGLGMPGCNLHVATLDATIAWVGSSANPTVPLQIPPGLLAGTRLHAVAAALFAPNSLPNGQNAFGAVTSNGVTAFISNF
jgi:hypothetical protein